MQMKYFIIIFLLSACGNSQQNVIQYPVATDSVDPYQTGRDTASLDLAERSIFNFPEVQVVNKRIQKKSGGKHGVAISARDNFNGDTAYYLFEVGDNSNDDRYQIIYNFLKIKKTGEIKFYDTVTDSILTLKEWREKNH
jgi:hypothetical protein